MTNNDIIKAKEHFTYGITHDIFSEPVTSYAKTALCAFDEINRQKAEIERLKEVRNEAIKEFVERLKDACWKNDDLLLDEYDEIAKEIDNLAKEMVGERE